MAPDSETFWDRQARKYARRPVADMASYDHTMERTRAHLAGADSVVELGCGTGTTALRLADCVGHITATDISSEMIAIAREKAAKQGATNATFAHADVFSALADGPPRDAVLAFNLFHLTEDPAEAIRAVHDALKPGGLFVSKTVCLGDRPGVLRVVIPVMKAIGMAPKAVAFLKVAELDRTIAEAGFEILETGVFPKSPPARFVVARKT
ncbi:class I SAM-dependent methyltransferase [Amorphus orientalis]|uniref:Ubiquinone/menaquinone biosynthesis C-methylase UbiE n=1 Tax=Amorphus orientalis TaxID=649198 RepID=A0AAE4AUE4_9HYPH|nr:class I SAM-dependent methyltransferase [Amorphus orientalis]MDQ0317338.1 ubiquinone/menaquinone biosynthesis C-methylase UbiE [Amorphus orientalis]